MKKYNIIAIVDCSGNHLPIEKMEFDYIGKDYAIGHYKGYGFSKLYSSADCYKVITEENKKGDLLMTTYTISEHWYNEIKDKVPHGEPYIYWDKGLQNHFVEVDVQEDIFEKVSKELGWMV